MKNGIMERTSNGDKMWRLNGLLHRTDGPAIENENGHKVWCLNGKIHRIDGPAVEYISGEKSWYLDDVYYGYEDTPPVDYVLAALAYEGMS